MNRPNHYPILSAAEFIAQGTTAGAIMSIAESLESRNEGHVPQPFLAARVRRVAEEVAALTGQTLQIPAALTNARQFARYKAAGKRRKRPANDNHGAARRAA